jgi:hypothetical protein
MNGMSDEPKKRSRAWIWWTPLAAIVLYLLTSVPVVIGLLWMIKAGVVSDKNAESFVSAAYAPVNWAQKHSKTADAVIQWAFKCASPPDATVMPLPS